MEPVAKPWLVAAPAARRGRPPSLAACGAASMQAVRAIAAQAHGAPSKAASPRRTCSPCQSSKWAKEEDGLFYLARSEYDLACGQV